MDVRISQAGTVVSCQAHHADGRLIGSVVVDKGTVQVAAISPEFQRQGYYPTLLKMIAAMVGQIRSSDNPTPHAAKAWLYAGALQSPKGWWYL